MLLLLLMHDSIFLIPGTTSVVYYYFILFPIYLLVLDGMCIDSLSYLAARCSHKLPPPLFLYVKHVQQACMTGSL